MKIEKSPSVILEATEQVFHEDIERELSKDKSISENNAALHTSKS